MAPAPRNLPDRSAPATSAPAVAPDVRAIASLAEYRACVALLEEVWGDGFECVPASVL